MHMRRLVTLALAAFSLAACGGSDKPAGPSASIAGTYTLQTVNGRSLPSTIFQVGNDKLEVTGGSVTMNENETFSGVTALRETVEGVVDDYSASCTGTYTRTGSTVAFAEAESDDCGGNYSGTWTSGNTLTVTFAPGIVAVFKK